MPWQDLVPASSALEFITGSILTVGIVAAVARSLTPGMRWLQARARLRLGELQQLNERLNSIVDNVADAIVTIDERQEILTWNQAAERIFGHTQSQAVGQPASLLLPSPPPGMESQAALKPAFLGARRADGRAREVIGRRRDGTTFPMDVAVSEFRLAGRRYFTGIIRDITERQRAADAQREAKDAADAANRAKSHFLANMSHEIRTPLGAIIGFSELLANPNQPPEQRAESLAAIKRNGELLSNIINDVLDLARVEAGKLTVERQDVALTDVMADIASLLGLQAREKGIRLTVTAVGSVPCRIQTDPLRLRQVLVNVVGNAIKFTARGSVDVSVCVLASSVGAPRLAFCVRDTGCGIPPGVATRLFHAFAQADGSSTRRSGGAGLGLVLARRLARLLGGDVVLTDTAPGQGSTFTVTVNPGRMAFTASRTASPAAVMPLHEAIRLDGIRVLLVDDSADNRLLVTRFLTLAGASVEVACNGREGVLKAQEATYDVIVMDIQMPVMDGYEAVARLRRRGHRGRVLALTAHALKEERQRCLKCGFDDHLSKPIERASLLSRVKSLAATGAGLEA